MPAKGRSISPFAQNAVPVSEDASNSKQKTFNEVIQLFLRFIVTWLEVDLYSGVFTASQFTNLFHDTARGGLDFCDLALRGLGCAIKTNRKQSKTEQKQVSLWNKKTNSSTSLISAYQGQLNFFLQNWYQTEWVFCKVGFKMKKRVEKKLDIYLRHSLNERISLQTLKMSVKIAKMNTTARIIVLLVRRSMR